MSNAMIIYNQFDKLQQAASALVKSGYFQDVRTEAQAIVKIMAGAELGLPPFTSMSGIHIIQGKPVLSSNLIATLVKNDPRYDYHIKTSTNTECIIEWLEGSKVIGTSEFTIAEAKTAGLAGKDNWIKYPSDMLFARALTRGARRFAPGIFGGSPIYTAEELNAETDEEGNLVIDAHTTEVAQSAEVTEPAQEQPAEKPEKEFNGNGHTLIYQAVVDAKLSENLYSAKEALHKCKTGYDTPEKAIAWMRVYRGWRDTGADGKAAASHANNGELPR